MAVARHSEDMADSSLVEGLKVVPRTDRWEEMVLLLRCRRSWTERHRSLLELGSWIGGS